MQVYGRIRGVLVIPELIFPKINTILLFRETTGLALCFIIGVSSCPKLRLLIKEPDDIYLNIPNIQACGHRLKTACDRKAVKSVV